MTHEEVNQVLKRLLENNFEFFPSVNGRDIVVLKSEDFDFVGCHILRVTNNEIRYETKWEKIKWAGNVLAVDFETNTHWLFPVNLLSRCGRMKIGDRHTDYIIHMQRDRKPAFTPEGLIAIAERAARGDLS